MSPLSEYKKSQIKTLKRQKEVLEQTLKNSHIDVKKAISQIDFDVIKSAQKQATKYVEMMNASYIKYISGEAERISKIELPKVQTYLQEMAVQSAELFRKNLSEPSPKVKESIEAMINIGWYPDINNFGVGSLINFKDELSKSDIDEVDSVFVAFYTENIPEIMKYLFEHYPHREEILRAAFDAHSAGNYILSIPVFLIQIDGIAINAFENHFFIKKRGTQSPEIMHAIENMNGLGEFSLALLASLQSAQPITYGEKQRDDEFNQLNRHQVIHGESLDYGTETNSYKAISLLLYISQAAEIVNRNHNGGMR